MILQAVQDVENLERMAVFREHWDMLHSYAFT